MRKESDKKNKKTSVTMTYSDFEIIEQKAKEKAEEKAEKEAAQEEKSEEA